MRENVYVKSVPTCNVLTAAARAASTLLLTLPNALPDLRGSVQVESVFAQFAKAENAMRITRVYPSIVLTSAPLAR